MRATTMAAWSLLLALVTATAAAQPVELTFAMPTTALWPGVPFWLRLAIQNSGAPLGPAQLFVALDVGGGDYWFWPSWGHYPPNLDSLGTNIPAGSTTWSILPQFSWPDGLGTGGAQFLSAVLAEGALASNVAAVAFSWSEEPPGTPTPTPTPGPTSPAGFVLVPAVSFTMGSPDYEMCRIPDETQHSVTLTRSFYIQPNEVTQAEWVAVLGTNPAYFTGDLQRPVENVTWFDCAIYCNRLSAAQGLRRAYYADASFTTPFDGTPPVTSGTVYWDQKAPGYRLPTESEWECACRAGTATAYNSGQNNTSCYEDTNLGPLAWYSYTSSSMTHAVGWKQANSWTLKDMHGNVWEWCWDWYGTYPGTATDPTGPGAGLHRVVRGGGWYYDAYYCRSAYRSNVLPGNRSRSLGFRPVRTGPEGFMLVPAGSFTMGSPSDEMCRELDETQHTVTLTRSFSIQPTEVTQAEWVAVLGTNPAYFTGDLQRPVESVTWFDCAIYCNRLSAAQGLRRAYYADASFTTPFDGTPPVTSGTVYWDQTAPGYRLPTESEWEYACRAVTTTAYNTGQNNTSCHEDPNLGPLAWYLHDSSGTTHAVGGKHSNSWTLKDMHGNVWEWCWDWYGTYPETAADPTGPDSGSHRVLRGGSWSSNARYCRSARRLDNFPGNRNIGLGFRPVRTGP